MWTYIEIDNYLKANLKDSRYIHSIGVSETAEKLALIYGCDMKKAKLAGMVHDCAKNLSDDEMLKMAIEHNCHVDNILKTNVSLLHGAVGAIIAKERMGIDDQEVLNSIIYHTTGKENMSLLEKIIYLADYIEPNRNFDGVELLRKVAFEDLNRAMLLAFDNTINYVLLRGQLLHLNTVKARNYLICNENR